MSYALIQETPRRDIVIRRGVSERFGVLWEEDAGTGFAPVDLSGWVCTFRLFSPMGELWLEKAAFGGVDGVALATVSPGDLSDDVWASRGAGQWTLSAVLGGRHERLGDGNYYLEV